MSIGLLPIQQMHTDFLVNTSFHSSKINIPKVHLVGLKIAAPSVFWENKNAQMQGGNGGALRTWAFEGENGEVEAIIGCTVRSCVKRQ